jgi:hypothetical protein
MHKFRKSGVNYETYWLESGSSADLDWYLALMNMTDETMLAQAPRVKDTGIEADGTVWTADNYVAVFFDRISEAFGEVPVTWKNQVDMALDARMPDFIKSIGGTAA